MDVARISFNDLKSYWIEVDHFRVPDKRIREVVRELGPYKSAIPDPVRYSYGLFDGKHMVGATHLVQWSEDLLRYRTLNIRKSHRGKDQGLFLLRAAIEMDWRSWKRENRSLLGWVRRDHHAWACGHGFTPYDGQWQDDHIAMTKPLDEF